MSRGISNSQLTKTHTVTDECANNKQREQREALFSFILKLNICGCLSVLIMWICKTSVALSKPRRDTTPSTLTKLQKHSINTVD